MKREKYSPTDQIEGADLALVKQSYVRFPGKMFVPVGKDFDEDKTTLDYNLLLDMVNDNKGKRYSMLNTRPYSPSSNSGERQDEAIVIPDSDEFDNFVIDRSKRALIIAQHNSDDDVIEGYHVWRKTKKTPDVTDLGQFKEDVEGYRDALQVALNDDDPSVAVETLDQLSKDYHLQQRFIPAEGFELDGSGTKFGRKGLEGELALGIVGTIVVSLLFFSGTITGAVTGLIEKMLNLEVMFAFLTLLIFVAAYFYFRRIHGKG